MANHNITYYPSVTTPATTTTNIYINLSLEEEEDIYKHHRMRTKPKVAIKSTVTQVMTMPVSRKSRTVRYGCWKSSTMSRELTLGKEEKGSAIAAETKWSNETETVHEDEDNSRDHNEYNESI